MIEETRHISPDFEVTDERFDIAGISESVLIIETAPYFLRIAVKDGSQIYRVLENYPIVKKWPDESWLKDLFENHRLLSARFWKQVKWLVHSESKTRIPAKIDPKRAREVLKVLTAHFQENDEVIIQDDLVFAINGVLYQWISGFYPDSDLTIFPVDLFFPEKMQGQAMLFFYLNGYGYFEKHSSYFSSHIENIYPLLNKDKRTLVLGEVTKYDRVYRSMELEFPVTLGSGSIDNKLTQYFSETPLHRYFCILNQ